MDAASIKATLQAKGQAMTLTRVTQGTYNPETGSFASSTSATHTVYGITSGYSSFTIAAAATKPDSLIKAGDILAIVEAVTITPVVGDTISIMGETWAVLNVDPVAPQGSNLLFKLHLRR
jgi:hypothetical protein